jgi:radical SAM protein with 4Fe4S-binding SPASM domain
MIQFKKIYIEITNQCNLSCSFCLKSKRPRRFMEVAEFESILSKVKEATHYICLHVLGEPLLHPQLSTMLDRCYTHDLKVNLSTNGHLLKTYQETLHTHPALRQINISLHSAETIKTDIERNAYLRSILHFVQKATETAPIFACLRIWNIGNISRGNPAGFNQHTLGQIQRYFNIPHPIAEKPTHRNGIRLAPNIFLSLDTPFSWPHLPGPDLGDFGTCRGIRDHIAILVDGTVVPCCLDAEADIPLGNINDQSLPDILNHQKAQKLRNGFLNQKISDPLCRRCSFRQRFHFQRKRSKVFSTSPVLSV